METVLLMALFAAANILCFVIGAKVSQKAQKDEEIRLPNLDPLEAYRDNQARKEAQRKQTRAQILLQNVENYNGTSEGQLEVPRRE